MNSDEAILNIRSARSPWAVVAALLTSLWAHGSGAATVPVWPLNDTGIDWWADGSRNYLPAPPSGYPGQDASFGRDATRKNDADGHAGFSFNKLDAAGKPLPASATAWSCVLDNVTGLIWEIKTDDGGLRDRDWTYSWYNPDGGNGGRGGTQNGGACGGGIDCDTLGFVKAVNQSGLCGAKDWRLPSSQELLSIADRSRVGLAMDTAYFHDSKQGLIFWSSSPYAHVSDYAWYVYFYYGNVHYTYKDSAYYVRLVRGGQAFGKTDQFITFAAAPKVFVGGTGTVTATGGASGNPVTFTSQTTGVCTSGGINGSQVSGVTAGTCTIAANQAGNDNYNPAPEVTQSFAVEPICLQCLPNRGGWRAILR